MQLYDEGKAEVIPYPSYPWVDPRLRKGGVQEMQLVLPLREWGEETWLEPWAGGGHWEGGETRQREGKRDSLLPHWHCSWWISAHIQPLSGAMAGAALKLLTSPRSAGMVVAEIGEYPFPVLAPFLAPSGALYHLGGSRCGEQLQGLLRSAMDKGYDGQPSFLHLPTSLCLLLVMSGCWKGEPACKIFMQLLQNTAWLEQSKIGSGTSMTSMPRSAGDCGGGRWVPFLHLLCLHPLLRCSPPVWDSSHISFFPNSLTSVSVWTLHGIQVSRPPTGQWRTCAADMPSWELALAHSGRRGVIVPLHPMWNCPWSYPKLGWEGWWTQNSFVGPVFLLHWECWGERLKQSCEGHWYRENLSY